MYVSKKTLKKNSGEHCFSAKILLKHVKIIVSYQIVNHLLPIEVKGRTQADVLAATIILLKTCAKITFSVICLHMLSALLVQHFVV